MPEDNDDKGYGRPPHRVTFVEIFFAVVLGASILEPEIRALLFPPAFASLSFWALIAVYFTAITSWHGWHKSTTEYPYTDSRVGEARSLVDALIVAVYAALLFFGSRLDNSLFWYLLGFVIVFASYFVSGIMRRTEYHTKEASQTDLIVKHGIPLVVGAIAYIILPKVLSQLSTAALWAFVLLPLLTMASYRWFRHWRKLPWTKTNKNRLTIAVDMDGVIVEQVVPVLQKLKKEIGVDLTKSDITDWEYPFKGTNIKTEIIRAEREKEFVLQMPPMEYAIEALQILSEKFDIVIATSRESSTDSWSQEWLSKHAAPYQKFLNTGSQGKALPNANIIIDDYVQNIEAFIRKGPPSKQAILFAQPWNHDTGTITDLITSGTVKIAYSWQAVLALLSCDLTKVQPTAK